MVATLKSIQRAFRGSARRRGEISAASPRPERLCFNLLLFGLLLLVGAESAQAQNFYVVKGRRGVITITNRQPAAGAEYKVFAPRRPAFSRFYGVTRTKWAGRPVASPFDTMIQETALENALDPALVKAVVHVESMFNPHARSPKGAMGLMQLMPGTATRFGVDNAYLPEENVAGGVRYLRMLHDRYEGDTRLALAAYNAGEGAVDRMRGIPPYAETQTYVKRVLRMTELYRCATAGRKDC